MRTSYVSPDSWRSCGVGPGVQHDLDVVVSGVLGEVEPQGLEPFLVRTGGGVHRDELGGEGGVGVGGLSGPGDDRGRETEQRCGERRGKCRASAA